MKFKILFTGLTVIGLWGCSEDVSQPNDQNLENSDSAIAQIDDARINNAESEPGNWLAYGRDYEEQRFSPLTQINRESVDRLGLAFELDLGSNDSVLLRQFVVLRLELLGLLRQQSLRRRQLGA